MGVLLPFPLFSGFSSWTASWVAPALAALAAGLAMPLIQEHRKADGSALAYWNKIFTALWALPFVLSSGFPSDPRFYGMVALTALLWCGADMVYFRALPAVGAAVVTRLLPTAIIVTFLAWFAFDPELLRYYLSNPLQSGLIALIVLASVYFASRLRKCEVSWTAAQKIWFLLFAAAVGPILNKLTLAYAPAAKAPYMFLFVQAVMMVALWSGYGAARRPPWTAMLKDRHVIATAAMVSVFSAAGVIFKSIALIRVEHPAYLSIVLLLDSTAILAIHRLTGRRDKSDLLAGFGMVACAVALIAVKSWQ